jgi:hypothetical protein
VAGRSTRSLARKREAVTVEAPSKTREPSQVVVSVGPVPALSSASQQSSHPEQAIPQSPWPPASHLYVHWEEFARFTNFWEGHILAGLLRNEDVPARVLFLWPSFDSGFSSVLVPRELLHRARWVLSWPAPSEAELTFLATGEFVSSQEASIGNASG